MSLKYPLLKDKKENASFCGCPSFVILLVLLAVCIKLLIWDVVAPPQYTPVIQTLDGPVQGNIEHSRNGKEYWQFLGIPYAMPPVGKRRFQPPVPVDPWETVKQVTSYPQPCAQLDVLATARPTGEIDCLFLNVFVNAANESGSGTKPVLVYIHGGGFLFGGSYQYIPDYFMDHDIVLVVMQYRLGPFGFLNLQEAKSEIKDNAKGNMGLKDQNLALKWVKRNIAQFGGSSDKITLIGQSAGAVSAHYHMLSPMSQGLFHRAVIQSSTILSPYAFSKKPRDIAVENARKFGCPVEKIGNDESTLLRCFENADWKEMVNFQHTLLEPLLKKDMFEVTVDGTFLKKSPKELIKTGDFPPIPVMFGINSAEGTIRSGRFEAMPESISILDKNWTDLVHNVMILDEPLPVRVSTELRRQYFGTMNFTEDPEGFKANMTMVLTDAGFQLPTHQAAIYHAKNGAPTYMYYFNYSSNFFAGLYTMYRTHRLDDWLPAEVYKVWSLGTGFIKDKVFGGHTTRPYGVSHAEEIFQLWNIAGIFQVRWFARIMSGWDLEFSQRFVKAVVDFANDTEPLKFGDVTWPPINDFLKSGKDEYGMPWMILENKEVHVAAEPFRSRMKFLAENIQEWLLPSLK